VLAAEHAVRLVHDLLGLSSQTVGGPIESFDCLRLK